MSALDAGDSSLLEQRFTTATQSLQCSADVLAESLQLLVLTRPSFLRTVASDAGSEEARVRLLWQCGRREAPSRSTQTVCESSQGPVAARLAALSLV